jgi:rRNA maturation protein Nop10
MAERTFRHSGVKSGQETCCTAGTQTVTFPPPPVHSYQPYGKERFRVTAIYIAG